MRTQPNSQHISVMSVIGEKKLKDCMEMSLNKQDSMKKKTKVTCMCFIPPNSAWKMLSQVKQSCAAKQYIRIHINRYQIVTSPVRLV